MPPIVCRSNKVSLIAVIRLVTLNMTILALLGCRQASPIPAEIVGDSMAPLLCGQRISESCPRCQIVFEYGISEHLKTLHCPNCGNQFSSSGVVIEADRVGVVPNQTPQRWDIVAFQHSDGKTLIKRVLGLPNETLSISDGEVIVNEEIIAKPDQVVQQTKRQVFDSKFSCPEILASLKLSADQWESQECLLTHPASSGDEFDWVAYRHQRKYPHRKTSTPIKFPPVEDDDGFNQSLTRRLNVVDELIVQTDLTLSANAEFRMRRAIRGVTYQATLLVDDDLEGCEIRFSYRDSELSFRKPCVGDLENGVPFSLLFSNVDRKISLVVNGETFVNVAELVDESDQQSVSDENRPFLKFGMTRRSEGRVDRLRIWRDIYYFAQRAAPEFELPVKLGSDEYFVVGDNVPVSQDSRHFGPVTNIIGTVDPLEKNETVDWR